MAFQKVIKVHSANVWIERRCMLGSAIRRYRVAAGCRCVALLSKVWDFQPQSLSLALTPSELQFARQQHIEPSTLEFKLDLFCYSPEDLRAYTLLCFVLLPLSRAAVHAVAAGTAPCWAPRHVGRERGSWAQASLPCSRYIAGRKAPPGSTLARKNRP